VQTEAFANKSQKRWAVWRNGKLESFLIKHFTKMAAAPKIAFSRKCKRAAGTTALLAIASIHLQSTFVLYPGCLNDCRLLTMCLNEKVSIDHCFTSRFIVCSPPSALAKQEFNVLQQVFGLLRPSNVN
jgi:hypothetical protein